MALDFSATYKLLVLGDSNVGKTCIVHRYCDERYYDIYISTIGEYIIYFSFMSLCQSCKSCSVSLELQIPDSVLPYIAEVYKTRNNGSWNNTRTHI